MPLSSLLASVQAIGFKLQQLSERRIQEFGAAARNTFILQRYALFPALVWSIIFIGKNDILYILHTPKLWQYLLAIGIIWNVQAFLFSWLLNTVSSMSALSTLHYLIDLPILLAVGAIFNGDIPNAYAVVAVALLMVAFIVQPAQHEKNIRARFSMPVTSIAGFILLRTLLSAANNALSREVLKILDPKIMIGAFSIIALGIAWVWTPRLKPSPSDAAVMKNHLWLSVSVPALWFLATIPESYSYAKLPIYTVVSIGAIVFIIDIVSDLWHRRIRLSSRTVIFIGLALSGITLAVRSI